jgi:hypothetical protein
MFPHGDPLVAVTRQHVLSATPDAPVVPDDAEPTAWTGSVRRMVATALRRTAEWVEPCGQDGLTRALVGAARH